MTSAHLQHIWPALSHLVDDVDAVVDPLPSEDGVQVVEPVLQVVFSVAERDDDGHLDSEGQFELMHLIVLFDAFQHFVSVGDA